MPIPPCNADGEWLIGLRAIARFMGRHERTIRRWIDDHGFPAGMLPSGHWIASKQSIRDWVLVRGRQVAERLMQRAPGLSAIGAMIAEHHERLDGSGFHRGIRASDLSPPSRLLAVVEAYQNLIENRPFRVSINPKQAALKLREAVTEGTLDGEAVACVLEAAGLGGRRKKVPFVAGLTAREVDVLVHVARGGTYKEIARARSVAEDGRQSHPVDLRQARRQHPRRRYIVRPGTRPAQARTKIGNPPQAASRDRR